MATVETHVNQRHMKTRYGPNGIHMFCRQSGLNMLLDEVHVPARQWSAAPRYVSIALTNACDLRCPYCYAPKHASRLSTGSLVGWLHELDDHGCLGVGFGGGEPTHHPNFVELCRYVSAQTGLAMTFTTHGHHLTEGMAADLRGCVHFIRVSMDGLYETYERLRGRPFVKFLRQLEFVRSIAPFGINFVVNEETFPELEAALTFAAEAGAAEFLLLPERPVNGHGGIGSATRKQLSDWVCSHRAPIPLSVSQAESTGLPVCDPLSMECGLKAFAHIDASGTLKRSSFDKKGIAIEGHNVLAAIKALEEAKEY